MCICIAEWVCLRGAAVSTTPSGVGLALARRLEVKETLNNSIFHDPSSVFLVRWEKKAIFGA